MVLFVLNAIIVEMGGDNMEIHTMQEIISEFLIRSRVFGMKFFVALLVFAAFLIPNSNMFTNPVVILKDNSKKDK